MSNLFTSLADAVVAAINAADLAGDLAPRVQAVKDYAPDYKLEKLGETVVGVMPDSFTWKEAALDGEQEHRLGLVLFVGRKLERADSDEIEMMLDLLSTIYRKIASGVSANSFELLGAEGINPFDPYSPDAVRNEMKFWSETKLNFRTYLEP